MKIVAMVVVAVAGCSGGASPKTMANLVPVQGMVTLDGEPLDHGTVGFAPINEKTGQPAIGHIKNGKFTMLTTVSAAGVVMGKYRVRIESMGEPEPLVPGKFPKPPASRIPAKYTDTATSGLVVEIDQGMAPVSFELTTK